MNAEYLLEKYRETGIIHPVPALSDAEIQQAQDNYRRICEPGQITLHGEQRRDKLHVAMLRRLREHDQMEWGRAQH